MSESQIFRDVLLSIMSEKGMNAAQLSRLAGLNPRAVKDIEEGRAVSPKLSTVFALAKALDVRPEVLMGLNDRNEILSELREYLSQYTESDQEQILRALLSLPIRPS